MHWKIIPVMASSLLKKLQAGHDEGGDKDRQSSAWSLMVPGPYQVTT